jgi:hypothetical protein
VEGGGGRIGLATGLVGGGGIVPTMGDDIIGGTIGITVVVGVPPQLMGFSSSRLLGTAPCDTVIAGSGGRTTLSTGIRCR